MQLSFHDERRSESFGKIIISKKKKFYKIISLVIRSLP